MPGDGEVMKFRGSKMFTWETDSAMRAEEVRYEWKIKGVVISEELDFDMPTDEVVKKIGLTRYSNDVGEWGTFSVIEKRPELRSLPDCLCISILHSLRTIGSYCQKMAISQKFL